MDKEGLLQEADGGYLFLDEIHRLSYENQEKLFIFMDTGKYRPLGDKNWKAAKLRLQRLLPSFRMEKHRQKLIRNRLRMAKPSLHPPKQRLPTEKLRLRRTAVN